MREWIEVGVGVLRDPVGVVAQSESDPRFVRLVPQLLGLMVAGAAVFGAVVGGYRGGWMVPVAAVKVPLVLLVPMVLVLPALRGVWGLCGVDVDRRHLALAGLVGVTRTALLAAALAPLLWLVFSLEVPYHLAVLCFVGSLGLAGLPGLVAVGRALPPVPSARGVVVASCVALLGVGAMQTGWLLRPFVLRPRTEHVVIVRPIEEDVFSALKATAFSSVGMYRSWGPAVDVERRRDWELQ